MWASNQNKIVYRIPAFDGGLNTKYTDVNMPPNQSPALQNVMFDDYGAVYGWIKYNYDTGAGFRGTAAVSSTFYTMTVDAVGKYLTSAGVEYLIAGYNGHVWYKTYNTGAYTSGDTIKSSVSMYSLGTYGAYIQYGFSQIENHLWITNQSISPHKWDGTKWSTVGVSNITGNLATASCGATGGLSGTYNYWISGVNSAGVEGDYSTLTTGGLVIAAGLVTLSSLPTWPTSWGVNTVNIYRNTAAAGTVPYLVASTSPTATTYSDNISDSLLTVEPPNDNGRPPNLKHIIYYRAQAFGFGNPSAPYRLYFSQVGDPEIWPTDNYFDVGLGDGDPISGIAVYANSICVHKNNGKNAGSIWMLYMPDTTDVTDASNWSLIKTPSAYGACTHKVICNYNNMLFFFNRYGAFMFNGQDVAISAADSQFGRFAVDSLSFEIEPDIKALPVDYLQYAEAINNDNKIWLSVVTSSSTKTKALYVYDYLQASDPSRQKGSWTKITQLPFHSMVDIQSKLFASYALSAPFVFEINGSNWSGSNIGVDNITVTTFTGIDSSFTTKKIYGYEEHRDLTKVWRAVNILVDLYTTIEYSLEVYYGTDLDETAGQIENVSLYYDPTLWGTGVWGTSTWAGLTKDREWKRIILQQVVGETLQLKFRVRNNIAPYGSKTFKIYETAIEYNLRGKR